MNICTKCIIAEPVNLREPHASEMKARRMWLIWFCDNLSWNWLLKLTLNHHTEITFTWYFRVFSIFGRLKTIFSPLPDIVPIIPTHHVTWWGVDSGLYGLIQSEYSFGSTHDWKSRKLLKTIFAVVIQAQLSISTTSNGIFKFIQKLHRKITVKSVTTISSRPRSFTV